MKPSSFRWPSGLKKTKVRRKVIECLEQSDIPLNARQISSYLESQGESPWLSTIYRTLEILTHKNCLQVIRLPQDETLYYRLCKAGHQHFAVCLSCHTLTALSGCPVERCAGVLPENFQVTGHTVELYGYCQRCHHAAV